MIRKIVKYISGFIVVIIILYIIKIGLIFSNFHPYKLIDNYYLIGMGDKNYVIKKGVFGATIVDNLTYGCGWIITPSSLHGYLGEYNRYFFV